MDETEQSKALELRSRYIGKELAEELTTPTPKELVKTRPIRGGGRAAYVAGPHFIRKLNDCFGFLWSYAVPESFELNGQIVGKGKLTVHVPVPGKKTIKRYMEGGKAVEEESVEYSWKDIVKEQFGSSEVKKYASTEFARDKKGNLLMEKGEAIVKHKAGDVIDLGDDYKSMSTDAMKKCSTELGIFLDVYESRAEQEEGGLATKAQLDVVYWRAKEAGMEKEDAERWGEEQVGKPIKEWEPLDAMGLVPKLIDLKEMNENRS